MIIQVAAAARRALDAPQQAWYGVGPDGAHFDDPVMQRALFGGQEMLVGREGDGTGRFGLRYLGFGASGFLSMALAKQAAPEFARRVLARMLEMVSD